MAAPDRSPDLTEDFAETLSRLAPVGPLGVAVSGGSDSMALLTLTHAWARATGRRIAAVTVDHGLRADAAEEARMVAAHCAEAGIAHDTLTARLETGNVMARAREARYRLMADWAADAEISAIALGHTMDDQAETVLMRLGRGAGVDGLSAMAPVRRWMGTTWVRPLLGVRREDLRGWLRGQAVDWVEDPTNDQDQYDRIKTRQALDLLAPLGVDVPGLADTAERLRSQRRVLDKATAALSAAATHIGQFGEVWLDPGPFRAADPELQRRVLGNCLVCITGAAYPPRHRTIAQALDALAQCAFTAQTLGGCLIRRDNQRILICREPAAATQHVTNWGDSALWDNRWWITGACQPPQCIAALGPEGLNHLRADAPEALEAAHRDVLLTLPAIWDHSDPGAPMLAAVPPLDYVNPQLTGSGVVWSAKLTVRHDDLFE